MVCDICKKNDAVIHIEKHAANNHTHMKICTQCAGIEALSPDKLKGEDLNRIISDLAAFQKPVSEENCEECGTTAAEYDKSKRVGCAKCYVNLRSAINLRAWQMSKNLKHIGRTPFKLIMEPVHFDEKVEDLQLIEEKLAHSIAAENYEEAARLRDKIAELKKALA